MSDIILPCSLLGMRDEDKVELEFIDISDRGEYQSREKAKQQIQKARTRQRSQQVRRDVYQRQRRIEQRRNAEQGLRRRMAEYPNEDMVNLVSGSGHATRRQSAGEAAFYQNRERQQQLKRQELKRRQARERYRQKQLRKRRLRVMMMKAAILCCLVLLVALLGMILPQIFSGSKEREKVPDMAIQKEKETVSQKPAEGPGLGIVEDFLTVNEYSRPGEPLEAVNNIFVHYTANPGTSAAQNRSYFENLGLTGETSASAHFVIGYEGEIIQCIPLEEIAYAVQRRNYDSVSIECCYLDRNGKFTDATYDSLVKLSAWLLKKYDLSPSDMRRHYDEGGKKCPLYFVEHEEAWDQFVRDLENYMANKAQT